METILFSFSSISGSRTKVSDSWKHIFKIIFLACHWKPFFCHVRTFFFQLLRLVERHLYENFLLLLMTLFFCLAKTIFFHFSDIPGCGLIFSIQYKPSFWEKFDSGNRNLFFFERKAFYFIQRFISAGGNCYCL